MDAQIYNLFYSDEKLKNVRNRILDDIKQINSIMKKRYSRDCIVIILSPGDKNEDKDTNIHIFENFLDANPLINREQKNQDQRISILQYDLKYNKFLFLMIKDLKTRRFKTFDKRQVEKMFNDIELESRILFLYNHNKTIINIH